jgi:hypothetical protein
MVWAFCVQYFVVWVLWWVKYCITSGHVYRILEFFKLAFNRLYFLFIFVNCLVFESLRSRILNTRLFLHYYSDIVLMYLLKSYVNKLTQTSWIIRRVNTSASQIHRSILINDCRPNDAKGNPWAQYLQIFQEVCIM